MVAPKLPNALPLPAQRLEAQRAQPKPKHEAVTNEQKPWTPKATSPLNREINRFQVYADRVSLVAYGGALLAEGGAVALGAAGVAVPALLPVAGGLAATSVLLNGVAGVIDIANASIDAKQAFDAGEGDQHLSENLKKAVDPAMSYVKKTAIGLFNRYVLRDTEQAAADFKAGYAKQDEALRYIEANPAFAAEAIPGIERAIGGGSALGLWFPKLGHVVMALEVPDMGVAYSWAKDWLAEGDLRKADVDAAFGKAFPNNKAAADLSRALGDTERFDAASVNELKDRVRVAETSLKTLEKTKVANTVKPATDKALARCREWVDELREEFASRDPVVNLRAAFPNNQQHAAALIAATNVDPSAARKVPLADLKKRISAADAALAQLKAVKFGPDVQESNDQLLRGFLRKTDALRDVVNARTNAFLMLPRAMTSLR